MAYVDHGCGSADARSALVKVMTFEGRADRAEFRRGAPALAGATGLALAAGGAALAPWSLAAPLAGAAGFALVALTVRRLHDVGADGWMVWLQLLLVAAMVATGAAIHGHAVSLLFGEGLLGSMALAVVALGAAIWRRVRRPGESGPNRFGPAPF